MNQQASSFIIYDASAGSGKTFTLVRNYLSDLLTEKVNYPNVLAITFTNKAVNEMKTRILDSLKAFSQNPIPGNHRALFEAVLEKTGLPEEEVQVRSQRLLIRILHNYAAFDVSTIDGFTHRILRIFAKDLQIPQNFEVEMEPQKILEEAVDRLIARAGEDRELTEALVSFALYKTDDDKSWDITRDLNEIAKLTIDGTSIEETELLKQFDLKDFKAFATALQTELNRLNKKAQTAAENFFRLLEENGLETTHFYRSLLPNYFTKVLQNGPTDPGQGKWVQEMPNAQLYKKNENEGVKSILEGMRDTLGELFATSREAFYRFDFLRRISNQNPSLSLLSAIQKEVSQIKEERKLLLISEFDKKISDSIRDEPAPFIYERLGERYHTYYIDEFQDTSLLQWQNLQPLIADTLAAEGGKLTLVGDAKQSIYRWRGGKPEQFMAFCAGYNPFPGAQHRIEKLESNFRSLSEVVEFNNAFFAFSARYLTHPEYQKLFEAAPQAVEKKEGGYVEINFLEAKNRRERDKTHPQKTLEIIQRLIEEKHDYKEICILVRKKDYGVAIANLLSEHDIPIITSETLLLANSPEVNFVINLLHSVLNPADKKYKYACLTYLFERKGWGESNFSFLRDKIDLQGQMLFDALGPNGLDFKLDHLLRLPLYQAIEYCIRSFALNHKPDIYLQFFLDFVYEYTHKNAGGIAGLLEDWEAKKEKLSIIVPEGQNAVQIMTIHKAKGLEFPVVIYPYANESLSDLQYNSVWVRLEEEPNGIPLSYIRASSKLENFGRSASTVLAELTTHLEMDAMNVFYVAMTRAEEQLYVLSDLKKPNKVDSLSDLLIQFLIEKGIWDAEKEEQVYSFGTPPPTLKTSDTLQEEEIQHFISSPPTDHEIHMVTSPASLWDTPQEAAIEEGLLTHRLLQEIRQPQDIPTSIEKAIHDGRLEKSQSAELQQQLEHLVQHPRLKPYFSEEYELFTEKEILSQGQYLRLDRLCIKEGEAAIIDYKTGGPQAFHKKQVLAYAKAIEKIGYSVKEKILVYINPAELTVESIN